MEKSLQQNYQDDELNKSYAIKTKALILTLSLGVLYFSLFCFAIVFAYSFPLLAAGVLGLWFCLHRVDRVYAHFAEGRKVGRTAFVVAGMIVGGCVGFYFSPLFLSLVVFPGALSIPFFGQICAAFILAAMLGLACKYLAKAILFCWHYRDNLLNATSPSKYDDCNTAQFQGSEPVLFDKDQGELITINKASYASAMQGLWELKPKKSFTWPCPFLPYFLCNQERRYFNKIIGNLRQAKYGIVFWREVTVIYDSVSKQKTIEGKTTKIDQVLDPTGCDEEGNYLNKYKKILVMDNTTVQEREKGKLRYVKPGLAAREITKQGDGSYQICVSGPWHRNQLWFQVNSLMEAVNTPISMLIKGPQYQVTSQSE